MPKKLTYAFVKNQFESEGYFLVSDKYHNAYGKLDFICPLGHKHSICWYDWQKGARCVYCSGKAKYTYGNVKEAFEKEGYTLLSKEYINSRIKLNYTCPYGHNGSVIFDAWLNGRRCFKCKYIFRMSGESNPNWQGGKSFEPYCSIWKDKEFKEDIKIRDGYNCLNPYCDSKNPDDLTIHHIDYNKKNCNPNNLITVCRSCNSRANKDRRWHKAWYKAIIKNRYSSGGL